MDNRTPTVVTCSVAIFSLSRCKLLFDEQAPLFREDLSRCKASCQATNVILDFQGVEFLASACIGAVLTYRRQVRSEGGRLLLCGMSPLLTETFTMGRKDWLALLDIHPDIATAIRSLHAQPITSSPPATPAAEKPPADQPS